ncbi:MAG: transposase [Sphingobacteriaceae bacterium]|nr:MAG: transposase [Sphingobacteriaceae bacterium]
MKTKNNQEAYAFVLIEHQSMPDYLIAFRLWKYMLLLCERYIKKYKDKGNKSNSKLAKSIAFKLPLIAPIVFYNGIKQYNAPLNLWQLFHNPELAKKLMADDYQLVDLQSMSDDEIKQKDHLGMIEFMMKHIHTRDMLKLWAEFLTSFKEAILLDKDKGYVYIKHLLWYTDSKVPEEKQQELNNLILKNLNQIDGENIMRTIAQKYIDEGIIQGETRGIEKGKAVGIQEGKSIGIQEGEARGMEKGIEKGMEKAALNMLSLNLAPYLIAQYTGSNDRANQQTKELNRKQ